MNMGAVEINSSSSFNACRSNYPSTPHLGAASAAENSSFSPHVSWAVSWIVYMFYDTEANPFLTGIIQDYHQGNDNGLTCG